MIYEDYKKFLAAEDSFRFVEGNLYQIKVSARPDYKGPVSDLYTVGHRDLHKFIKLGLVGPPEQNSPNIVGQNGDILLCIAKPKKIVWIEYASTTVQYWCVEFLRVEQICRWVLFQSPLDYQKLLFEAQYRFEQVP